MVLTSNGLVLTNNHVVDGATSLPATVVSTRPDLRARRWSAADPTDDVALIKLVGRVRAEDGAGRELQRKVKLGTGRGGARQRRRRRRHADRDQRHDHRAEPDDHRQRRRLRDHSETLHGMLQTNAPIAAGRLGRRRWPTRPAR